MPKLLPSEQNADSNMVPEAADMRDVSYKAPEEWAASSHGAVYILAPIHKGAHHFLSR